MKKILVLIVFILVLSGSCTTVRYVPVERTRIEYRDRYKLDSIYYRDTVELYRKGDTIYNNVTKWRDRYTFVRDTVYRVDSIPVIREVEKIVEVNKLTKWQSFRLKMLNIVSISIALFIVIFLFIRRL